MRDQKNLTAIFNLQGTFIGNGIGSFITDGYLRNSIENLMAFNNEPVSLFEEYKKLGCEMYDSNLVKDKPTVNKVECEKYLSYFNASLHYVEYQNMMANVIVQSSNKTYSSKDDDPLIYGIK